MSSHREGVNPLRPYYIPPSIGEPIEPTSIPGPKPFSHGNSTGQYASRARDIFSDLDYKDYISEPSPSAVRSFKELVDELLWKYTSVLMAQPFEVAKTILQVRTQDDLGGVTGLVSPAERPRQPNSYKGSSYGDLPDSDSESDPDEPAYFTSTVPATPTPSYPRSQRPKVSSPLESPRTPRTPQFPPHQLNIRRPDSVTEVISQLWQKEGAWGVWKGSNASFLYTVIQSLLENWSRSLLSALFNVPDLGVKDDLDRLVDIASPYPWVSVCVAAAAAIATGLILSPLDMVRTRLIVTSTSRSPRRTIPILRSLPSYVCPPALVIPTIFHSLVHPVLALSTPLVLRTKFMIDREVSPTTFSVAKFVSSSVALFVKLPIETVLRRGQVAVLSEPAYVRAVEQTTTASAAKGGKVREDKSALETIVPAGKYDGVFRTMYTITKEEGSRLVPTATAGKTRNSMAKKGKAKVAETVYLRGQGLEGLWRGWKVNWWGLVGLWTAGMVSGGGDGEF
ncbi:hypothetical protein NKR23_g10220 [Pleurostoma richardsiae]|uniref:Mitochondrial fusion protein n=1 Tax=Pleurostoma richardsiae TaxID=41990 RepID=A0AA38VLY0_9PEZI|nr:hypothetical protein NKR23_g10220 [Pleurostoma richardsiae]